MPVRLTFALVGIALVLAVIAALLFLAPRQTSIVNPPTGTATTTQTGTGNGGGVATVTQLEILTKDGATIRVPDFTKGLSGKDVPGGPYYYLIPDPLDGTLAYQISYGQGDSKITIGLFKEPLGQTRLSAEEKLRTFFPLTNDELCALQIEVLVPVGVNSFYAGKNLGLSFCPNSVVLPQ